MRRSRLAFCAALFFLLFLSTGGDQSVTAQAQEKEKEVTIEGEIVEVYCYMSRHQGSGKGAEHAPCANGCIRKGGVVGFVSEEGDLYMLLTRNSTPLKTKVAGLAGHKVKVTGTKVERNDVEAIVVRTIARVRQTS